MDHEGRGISRRHAIELLRADHASTGSGSGKLVKNSTKQKLDALIEPGIDDARLLEQVVTYYANILKVTPAAIDPLQKHGITRQAVDPRPRRDPRSKRQSYSPVFRAHQGEDVERCVLCSFDGKPSTE